MLLLEFCFVRCKTLLGGSVVVPPRRRSVQRRQQRRRNRPRAHPCPEEAIPWLERAGSAAPELPFVHALLAAAHGLKGDIERAAAELTKVRRLAAANRWSSIAHLKAVGYWGTPKVRALFEATYMAGLRKAGMADG
jgi:hypothetical protein